MIAYISEIPIMADAMKKYFECGDLTELIVLWKRPDGTYGLRTSMPEEETVYALEKAKMQILVR